jgi:HEAT repeat protein
VVDDPEVEAARAAARALLEGALHDSDWNIRSAAAIALGRSGTVQVLPELVRMHGTPVKDVRRSAGLGIGLLGDPIAVDDLSRVLFNPHEEDGVRSAAALALGTIGGEFAASVLSKYIDPAANPSRAGGLGRTATIEETAIVALGMTGHRPSVAVLRKFVATPNQREAARAYASVALARLGDREAMPMLLQALRADPAVLRQSAAIALGMLATPADAATVEDLVRSATMDRDPSTRRFAILSLGRVGGPAAKATLNGMFGRGRQADLPFVALALGLSGRAESSSDLRSVLRSTGDPELRGASAIALGLLADRNAGADLLAIAQSKENRYLRGHCFEALGMMGHRPAAAAARGALAVEKDPSILLPAVVCLSLLGERNVIGDLTRIAREGCCDFHRGTAFRLMGMVGDASTLPGLVAMARDCKETGAVRTQAVAAVGAVLDLRDVPRFSAVGMDGNFPMYTGTLKSVLGL